ncbi:hypothetical protein ACF0H5_010573 [Mactra antiquata]
MDVIGERVQNEATKMFNGIEKDVLRKMMKGMHTCSAKCCDNTSLSSNEFQRCLETCSEPLMRVNNYLDQEVKNFQNRLNRCAMDCQDVSRDKLTANMSATDQLKVKQEFETCVGKCGDETVKKIPELDKRLRESLKQM